ncbi:MAG: IS200/IS605 family transposase [Elusimicrobiota bacterium]
MKTKKEEYVESLAHSRYDCKYHVVFVPKFRKKTLFGKIRKYLKGVFHELAKQKGCEIISGHLALDHVHMCISIPPKYAVSEVIGYLKGKSAIAVARQFGNKKKNFNGENFWARGYAVSTVGFELEKVKEYIEHQEKVEIEQEEGKF